jgi:dethiobiotin synthetase
MFELHTNFKFPEKFVVVGTDTGVGKTVISTLLLHLLNGTYWKPIQSGTQPETDTQFVKNTCCLPDTHVLNEAYIFSRPLAASQAARLDGKEVDVEALKIPLFTYKPLIIETAGGVMSPIKDHYLFIDLLQKWKLPVVIVARSTLGTINHTLLTIKALESYGVPILGIIFNGPKNTLNKDSIEQLTSVPVIAEMTPVDDLKEVCKTLYAEKI